MAWTYLTPRSSTVASSPAPTTTAFSLQTGDGPKFIVGSALQNGYECVIRGIVGDVVTLTAPLSYVPVTGQPFIQTILNQKDMVRLLVGDTDDTDQQLQDEEIGMALALHPNVLRAAALCAEMIAGKLARAVDYQVYQEIQEKMSDASKAYFELADRLRREAARSSAIPLMGGLNQIDKQLAIADITKVKPFFTRVLFTEPGTETDQATNQTAIAPPFF